MRAMMSLLGKLISKKKQFKENKDYQHFLNSGKLPWTRGYEIYKRRTISEYIDNKIFRAETLIEGYGFRIDERIVEYPWLFSRLPIGSGKLLDAGSALNFPYIFEREPLNSKNIFISTLAPEKCYLGKKKVSYVFEDLRKSCFKTNFFDHIVSISTVEHIGLDNTLLYTDEIEKNENNSSSYKFAISEFYRMLKPGGTLYLTVPFGKHKNHKWFQVFDAKMVSDLINTFEPRHFHEWHYGYEQTGWVVSTREKSKDATCFDINVQKDYDSDFAAFSRGIVCLELVK